MSKDTIEASGSANEMGLSLEELIPCGARELIQQAIELEVQELWAKYGNVRMLGGRRAVVRNGYLLVRQVLTANGPLSVRLPKVRDRSGTGVKVNSRLWCRLMCAARSGCRRRCRGCIGRGFPAATYAKR